MLFAITTWIVALTVIGILAVCVFRAICEPEQLKSKNYDEKLKLSPEINHYEPLNHELKTVEVSKAAEDAKISQEQKNDVNIVQETNQTTAVVQESQDETGRKPIALAIRTDGKLVEVIVPEEKKPLNTQTLDSPDALKEARVSSAPVKPTPIEIPVTIETQHREPVAPINSHPTDNHSDATATLVKITSPTPVAKVSNVTVQISATESAVERIAVLESQKDSPAPQIDVTAVQEQPNNNDIPTPYHEVESATVPRLNSSSTNKKTKTTEAREAVMLPA